MMKEAEWRLNKEVPSVDEYMTNGYMSIAVGPIILPAVYFVGPEIPEDVVSHSEYHKLFKLRECEDGKLNGLPLRIFHSHGSTSEEEAKQEMQRVIDSSRAELLRMVLQQDGSVIPRPCKDLFWKMCRVLHLFYMKNDGLTSPTEMVNTPSNELWFAFGNTKTRFSKEFYLVTWLKFDKLSEATITRPYEKAADGIHYRYWPNCEGIELKELKQLFENPIGQDGIQKVKEGDVIKLALLLISHCMLFRLNMRAAAQPWALMLEDNIVEWNDFPWEHTNHIYDSCNSSNNKLLYPNGSIERIKEQFQKIQLSPSSYDTAWVAMVPSPVSSKNPCFPDCVDWILENQHSDGSWGLHHSHPSLIKDGLSSTLACILALRRWKAGQKHVKKGRKAYLAYVGEGLMRNSKKWKEFMKYQRKNGSLFNSPSTTAAALMHQYDAKAHHYLHSLLSNFGGSVPTAYPLDVHAHLRTVDMVEKLGIARHFEDEIRSVLDRIYECWLMNDEEIFLEPTTLAMAFRILRMNGYNVSPDCLSQLSDANYFNNTLEGYVKDVNAVSESYKASQVKILPNEECLDNLGSWSRMFLKQALTTNQRLGNRVALEEEISDHLNLRMIQS
ncbi:hypothetical protein Cni_G24642 [Canna indica]|uniref:Terpene synthase N-terminal domain-containing protein n=1 Tax=Canna indica TaxID=4628 RepID=A0AAQ3QKA8_9LILI|nr:hypothetical protein Cni_G24642 [Canna indica]